ncbi:MAG: sugar ABC transporter ATP-binding protein [Firmicutes bacterium]|nr:sugar ABC transporter ATP-binding protein [Bacillota bacterium]
MRGTEPNTKNTALLSVRGLEKSYGHVRALRDVDIDVFPGEVLAVVGDNGAGKSTLIKILSGAVKPDRGEICIGGKTYKHLTPARALKMGISTVYQDLALVDCRDLACNVFLGREPTWFRWFVNQRKMEEQTSQLLTRLRISVPSVRQPVGLLSGGQRQAVAVARTIQQGGRIIIMDEPTAAMGVKESVKVLELIRGLASDGYTIILISHNLHHVFTVSDRICVMRHGHVVGCFITENTDPDEVMNFITGSNDYQTENAVKA